MTSRPRFPFTLSVPSCSPASSTPSPSKHSRSREAGALLFLLLILFGSRATPAAPLFHAPFLSYDTGHTFATGFDVGDVNGDAKLDLVAISEPIGFNGFTVRLGNGDGTFGPNIDHDLQNGFSEWLTLADLDQDNKLDVAVAASSWVMIRFGNGDGTFRAGPQIQALYSPDWVTAVDMNADHMLDLVFKREVAYQVYAVSVILGTGNGTFGPITDFPLAGNANPQGLELGDLNGDGHIDAVVPVRDGPLKILLGQGAGTFAPEMIEENYVGRIYGRSPVLADVNHDDHLDAVIPAYPDTVLVLLGLGNGHFGPATPFMSGPSALYGAVGDLDSDGNVDVMVTNESNGTVSVLRGMGDGTFGPHAEFEGGSGTPVLGDFDHDQFLDLALHNRRTVSILLGNGDATFGSGHQFSQTDYSFNRIVSEDVNGDARADLLISGYYAIGIYLGNGDGTFTKGNTLTEPGGGIGTEAIAMGDFDEDGDEDMVVSSGYTFVRLWFSNGDGTFAIGQSLPVSDYSRAPAVADLNRDSHEDIAVPVDGNIVTIFYGNGDGTFGTSHDYGTGLGPRAVAIGDLNGDDFPDLVTTGEFTSALLNDGAGGFGTRSDYLPYASARSLVLARLNHDAALDVVVDSKTVMLGNGDGTFGPANLVNPSFGETPLSFAAVDANDDGEVDIATTGFLSCCLSGVREGASVLLGNGDGTFQPPLDFGGGVGAMSLVAADLDGNGTQDLATTNFLSYSVGIFLNATETETNGAPDCSAASPSASALWPPNHTFVPISIQGVTDPEGDPVTIVVTSVTQDEALLPPGATEEELGDAGGSGGIGGIGGHGGGGGRRVDHDHAVKDPTIGAGLSVLDQLLVPSDDGGNVSPQGRNGDGQDCADAIILDDGTVMLRSERLGKGNGRVYVITFTARDPSGGECPGTVKVCVPHSRRRDTCVDDGQAVNSLGSCTRRSVKPQKIGIEDLALRPLSSNGSVLTLEFGLPEDNDVVVAVFDILGRRLTTLESGHQPAGWHTVSWNTSGVPSGMYFVKLRAGGQVITRTVPLRR